MINLLRCRSLCAAGVALALVGASVATATSAAADGPTTLRGTVTRIIDGDTVEVDVDGDGTSDPVTVRNIGIQAMEMGQCHATEAKAVMSDDTLGKRVVLTSKFDSSRSQGRLVRSVDVPASNGTVDPQLDLLQQGLALWLVIPPEDGRAVAYHTAMEEAAKKKIGLWDNNSCGSGPTQSAKLKLWVNYDGDGDEMAHPNNESVQVMNNGTKTVNVGGWWIRSAAQDTYVIPTGISIKPHKTLTLRVGKGTNTASTLHWGWDVARFQNLTTPGAVGGGAYLYDPQGDIRAHASYPCVVSCSDPATGKVSMSAHYDAAGDDMTNPDGEWVDITSTTTKSLDLSWRVLQIGGSTRQFGPGTVLKHKGSSMRVYVGSGTSTTTVKYWGRDSAIMPNTGGFAQLRSSETVEIGCVAWAGASCPS